MANKKRYISTITILMVTKIFRVVRNHKVLPPIYLDVVSTRWTCEVTWQIKYIIYPPTEDPWTPN